MIQTLEWKARQLLVPDHVIMLAGGEDTSPVAD
jgi:hypothetical protein